MKIQRTTQAKIHIAKQQLHMAAEDYQCLLQRTAGATSSKQLTERQGQAVLVEMSRLGWAPKPTGKTKGRPHNFDQLPGLITKVEAILADLGLPWSYADAIANKMWKRQRIAWTREPEKLKAVLVALTVEQRKRALLAYVQKCMAILGPTDPKWHSLLDRLPAGWERRITTLEQLSETLGLAVEQMLEEQSDVDGR